MSELPANPSESTRKRNPHLYVLTKPTVETTPVTMVRQSNSVMNKTEAMFYESIKNAGSKLIYIQSITLKLANGVRYTPDFVVVSQTNTLVAYEVKGFMRDDAAVKIKCAAKEYPWITFYLIRRKKLGWQSQQILP